MRLKWWEIGISLTLLVLLLFKWACTFDQSGVLLEEVPQNQDNVVRCACRCEVPPFTTPVIDVFVDVCMPLGLNANLNGGNFDPVAMEAFCTSTVEQTLTGLQDVCWIPGAMCSCPPDDAPPGDPLTLFDETCNAPGGCDEELLALECANWIPGNGIADATNAREEDEPVCIVSPWNFPPPDPASPAPPAPLSSGVFGNLTSCQVDEEESVAMIMVDGNETTTAVQGLVGFSGQVPCSGSTCSTSVNFNLELANFGFSGFFGLATVDIEDVKIVGASNLNAVTLDQFGEGEIPAGTIRSSARGTRIDDDLISFPPGNKSGVCWK